MMMKLKSFYLLFQIKSLVSFNFGMQLLSYGSYFYSAEGDYRDVILALKSVEAQWKQIGIQLGITFATLDSITLYVVIVFLR